MRWVWASLILVVAEAGFAHSPDPFDPKYQAKEKKEDPARADERLLLSKNIRLDDASLLQFFRERTLSPKQIEALTRKVKDLGAVAYKDRNQAMNDLVAAGSKARPVLLQVVRDSKEPLEIIRRVELCLRKAQDDSESELAAAAVRRLSKQRPAGTIEALLNYLPFASGPDVIEEIQGVLPSLVKENKLGEGLLIQTLKEQQAIKRGVAGAVLIRSGAFARVPALGKLLKDTDPQVRFQVASALLQTKNKAAIPVLIDLIPALPAHEVWQVEEILDSIAGVKGPNVYLDPDHPPAQVRAAWSDWWKENQSTVNLARINPVAGQLGLTLITQMDKKGSTGRVFELKADKEIAWQIDGLRYPIDAHIIGKDRVLIAEYLNRRVIECDFKGKVLWEKSVLMPIACQRLANGQTFIATRKNILIVEPDGKEVFTYSKGNTSICAAARLRDGQIILITNGGILERLDANGRLLKTFPVGSVYTLGSHIDVLPGGRVLVPQYREGRVVEYDADGRILWQVRVSNPTSAVLLKNGNVLVVSGSRQVQEFTRDGREVWSYLPEGRPWRARKR